MEQQLDIAVRRSRADRCSANQLSCVLVGPLIVQWGQRLEQPVLQVAVTGTGLALITLGLRDILAAPLCRDEALSRSPGRWAWWAGAMLFMAAPWIILPWIYGGSGFFEVDRPAVRNGYSSGMDLRTGLIGLTALTFAALNTPVIRHHLMRSAAVGRHIVKVAWSLTMVTLVINTWVFAAQLFVALLLTLLGAIGQIFAVSICLPFIMLGAEPTIPDMHGPDLAAAYLVSLIMPIVGYVLTVIGIKAR